MKLRGFADDQSSEALAGSSSGGLEEGTHHGVALVIGSEGQGLSKESRISSHAVSIPMPGEMESLNASHAGAILMFMLSRQWPLLVKRLDAAVAS